MKPWIINTILIIVAIVLAAVLPRGNFSDAFFGIVAFGSAIWVYMDASKLEVQKYRGSFWGTGPVSRAIIVIILWIIAFPAYISFRKKVIDGKIPLKAK